jgi:hypothetical protein
VPWTSNLTYIFIDFRMVTWPSLLCFSMKPCSRICWLCSRSRQSLRIWWVFCVCEKLLGWIHLHTCLNSVCYLVMKVCVVSVKMEVVHMIGGSNSVICEDSCLLGGGTTSWGERFLTVQRNEIPLLCFQAFPLHTCLQSILILSQTKCTQYVQYTYLITSYIFWCLLHHL